MASLNDNLFTNFAGVSHFPSALGRVRVHVTDRGIAEIAFGGNCGAGQGFGDLGRVAAFRAWLAGFERMDAAGRWDLLDPGGSEFQRRVWRRLLEIPPGGTRSYGAIARQIGQPSAARAVGSAVGANPIAVLLPCHRVLPKAGGVGHYRWGVERKRALLDVEQESRSALASLFYESR